MGGTVDTVVGNSPKFAVDVPAPGRTLCEHGGK